MKVTHLTFIITILFFAVSNAQIPTIEESAPAAPKSPTTTIEFEETVIDFGQITQNEKVVHVFKFKNTGDEPLVLINAKGSCGCTVPFWPKAPILPGESSEIEVEFNSKGKKGMQSKRVSITANTDPAMTFLTFKGEVLIVPEEELATREENANPKSELAEMNPDCIAIYPNPTSETLQLELRDYIGETAIVDIYNDMGQLVVNKTIDRISRTSTQFDVSAYTPGIYTVSIRIKDKEMKPLSKCFIVIQ